MLNRDRSSRRCAGAALAFHVAAALDRGGSTTDIEQFLAWATLNSKNGVHIARATLMALAALLSGPKASAVPPRAVEQARSLQLAVLSVVVAVAPPERVQGVHCALVVACVQQRLQHVCRQLEAWSLDWSGLVAAESGDTLSADEVGAPTHMRRACSESLPCTAPEMIRL